MNKDPIVRLKDYDLITIKELFLKHFQTGDKLWIFGSRVDMSQKGGDIDLYVETSCEDRVAATDMKRSFWSSIQRKLGQQKIDIVLRQKDRNLPIYEIAKKTGVKLI